MDYVGNIFQLTVKQFLMSKGGADFEKLFFDDKIHTNLISSGFLKLKLPRLFVVTACILLSIFDVLGVYGPSLQPFSWP